MLDHYAFGKSDAYPCGIKGCATSHQHGYLVKTSDGVYTNIGNICGKKYLDLDFDRVRKEYSARRKASDNLSFVLETRHNNETYQIKIQDMLRAAQVLAKCRRRLHDLMPGQLSMAITMGRRGMRDVVYSRRMSKREAEIHYEQTNTSSKDYPGRRPRVEEIAGNLLGAEIFREDIESLIKKEIAEPINAVTALSEFNVSVLTNKQLEVLSRNAGKALNLIRKAEELLALGVKFYSASNISLFKFMDADEDTVRKAVEELSAILSPTLKRSE